MSTEFEQSGELRPGLFPEETAEEAVARIVAQNPQKHGVPLTEREHRLVEQARRIAAETQAFFDAPDEQHTAELQQVVDDADALANQVAGAPTMTEEGLIPYNDLVELEQRRGGEMRVNGRVVARVPEREAPCEHQWPEDPDEDTRCPTCGLTFKEWVES